MSFTYNEEVLRTSMLGAIGGLIGGKGASLGNTKSIMSHSTRLAKKIFNGRNISKGLPYYCKETSRALIYYGKNMKNGAGLYVYKELQFIENESILTNEDPFIRAVIPFIFEFDKAI